MKAHIARNQNAGIPLALGWNLSPADRGKLDGIPGIGEARKQVLLKRFGTVKAIEAASLDDLRKLLPAPAASAVYAHLHPQEPPKTQKD